MEKESQADDPMGILQVALATAIMAVSPFLLKAASASFSSAQIVFYRYLAAGAMMLAAAKPSDLLAFLEKHFKASLALSFFGISFGYFAFIETIRLLPVGLAVFITDSYPVFAIGLGSAVLGEKLSKAKIAATLAVFAGIWLVANPSGAESLPLVGVATGLACLASWATSTVISKHLSGKTGPATLTASRFLLGAALMSPLLVASGQFIPSAPVFGWALLGALSLMAALSQYSYYAGMAKTSLATTAVIEASSPAITLAIAVALLGESISAASFAWCLVILFAVIAVSLPAGKASASTKACPT